jgi:hypothetical protein
MVIRHDGQPRTAGEAVLGDPPPDGFGHAAEFGVGATLNLIVALEFECDVVRPALGAFDKTVVESGHESWGIYTKNSARFAEPPRVRERFFFTCCAIFAVPAGIRVLFPRSCIQYARLKQIRLGSSRPPKDFTV